MHLWITSDTCATCMTHICGLVHTLHEWSSVVWYFWTETEELLHNQQIWQICQVWKEIALKAQQTPHSESTFVMFLNCKCPFLFPKVPLTQYTTIGLISFLQMIMKSFFWMPEGEAFIHYTLTLKGVTLRFLVQPAAQIAKVYKTTVYTWVFQATQIVCDSIAVIQKLLKTIACGKKTPRCHWTAKISCEKHTVKKRHKSFHSLQLGYMTSFQLLVS